MTKLSLVSCLAIAVSLTSCGTSPPKGAITVERLSTLEKSPPLSTTAVTITARIQQKDSSTTLPVVKAKIGQKVKIEVVKEFPYPTKYDLPRTKVGTAQAGFPVTPTTPKSFDKKNLGIELQLTPTFRGP